MKKEPYTIQGKHTEKKSSFKLIKESAFRPRIAGFILKNKT